MNKNAEYIGNLFNKDKIIEMYADLKRKLEAINVLILKYQDNECVICQKEFETCHHWYNLAEEYLAKIEEIIKGASV